MCVLPGAIFRVGKGRELDLTDCGFANKYKQQKSKRMIKMAELQLTKTEGCIQL